MKTKSKSRRQPTEEQKQAAVERRERIKGLCRQIKAMPDEQRVKLSNAYGIRTCEGRELSPYNQCLLILQNSNVSLVGGFAQWRELGRTVRKGEKALAIWVPTSRKAEGGAGAIVPAGVDPADLDERFFILGNVFDIAQTETADEREAREACEASTVLALPAPPLALPYRAEAIDVETVAVQGSFNL